MAVVGRFAWCNVRPTASTRAKVAATRTPAIDALDLQGKAGSLAHNHFAMGDGGVIREVGSRYELQTWLTAAVDDLRRKGPNLMRPFRFRCRRTAR